MFNHPDSRLPNSQIQLGKYDDFFLKQFEGFENLSRDEIDQKITWIPFSAIPNSDWTILSEEVSISDTTGELMTIDGSQLVQFDYNQAYNWIPQAQYNKFVNQLDDQGLKCQE